MNIDELTKQDERWQKAAVKICGDSDFAKDMVQEMYISCLKYDDVNSSFVYKTLMNVFLMDRRQQKAISIDEHELQLTYNDPVFEPDDVEQQLINRFNELYWTDREILLETYDHSFRGIQKAFPMIHFMYAYRRVTFALSYILGDRLSEHNNHRLKRDRNG
jgi:DNA-directed RNA polymerase specialized sigma24 family protein